MHRLSFFCALSLILSPALTALDLRPGEINPLKVEIPPALRSIAGDGWTSRVKIARVAIALPRNFDPSKSWPIILITATSDPRYRSSNRLLTFYAPTAISSGWIAISADPESDLKPYEDGSAMRFALLCAALAALEVAWPESKNWPIAVGGFSGGAKHAGWIAAMFTHIGRRPIGLFQAGINQETLALSAKQIGVRDSALHSMPIFLLAGEKDRVATVEDHLLLKEELVHAGFRQVKLETFPGPHAVDPRPLQRALAWFEEVAAATEREKK